MRIAIVGGDKRMLFAAREFMRRGAEVSAAGFDNLISDGDIRLTTISDSLSDADAVILPVRPAVGETLCAPFSTCEISLPALAQAIGDRPVYSGNSGAITRYFSVPVRDYAAREDFLIRNAALTAEGTVGLLVNEYEGAVFGARILVLGYGRIGRILSRYLHGLGASVTVAARRTSSLAWASCEGLDVDYNSDSELNEDNNAKKELKHYNNSEKESYRDNNPKFELKYYDIIINTIPALILGVDQLSRARADCFIIDLASMPGGVDHDAAQALGLTCIHALALPGRIAPAAAGRIITETILQMIKEENGGKDNTGLCDDRLLLHL